MIRDERVDHRSHRDGGEQERGDEGRAVAEVQHADGERAQDDGEVQPREEGALVGEEDFRLDAYGERDALAWGEVSWEEEEGGGGRRTWGGLEEGLARHLGGLASERLGGCSWE